MLQLCNAVWTPFALQNHCAVCVRVGHCSSKFAVFALCKFLYVVLCTTHRKSCHTSVLSDLYCQLWGYRELQSGARVCDWEIPKGEGGGGCRFKTANIWQLQPVPFPLFHCGCKIWIPATQTIRLLFPCFFTFSLISMSQSYLRIFCFHYSRLSYKWIIDRYAEKCIACLPHYWFAVRGESLFLWWLSDKKYKTKTIVTFLLTCSTSNSRGGKRHLDCTFIHFPANPICKLVHNENFTQAL